jgi:hypothetical protein
LNLLRYRSYLKKWKFEVGALLGDRGKRQRVVQGCESVAVSGGTFAASTVWANFHVLAGFMTHMCVNSTARGAFNLGYAPTVVANATATRALPGTTAAVPPATLQAASLAALGDLFAIVAPDSAAIPD